MAKLPRAVDGQPIPLPIGNEVGSSPVDQSEAFSLIHEAVLKRKIIKDSRYIASVTDTALNVKYKRTDTNKWLL